jgi:murein L,D-transpeptidase YafK
MAHKSLAISYPNNKDRQFARKYGKPTGGDVMIHGILNGDEANAKDYVGSDWTWGCIAITNEEVDELFTYVKLGAPINILP